MNKKLIAFFLAAFILLLPACTDPEPGVIESPNALPKATTTPFTAVSLMYSVWYNMSLEGGDIKSFEFGRDDLEGFSLKEPEIITSKTGEYVDGVEPVTDFDAMDELLGIKDARTKLVDGSVRYDKDTNGELVTTILVQVRYDVNLEEVKSEMFEYFKQKYDGTGTKYAMSLIRYSRYLMLSIGGIDDENAVFKEAVAGFEARFVYPQGTDTHIFK
ncbi:MAG: hypothetical protein IJA35_00340 [Clostridia bacterium]|nr:hypothetical protein [Clostridia bacterium]